MANKSERESIEADSARELLLATVVRERNALQAEIESLRAACRAALLGLDAAGACDPDVACGYNTSLGGETTQEHDIIHADEHMAYRLLRAVLQQEQPGTEGIDEHVPGLQ